jgi:16S rRNA (uracil1498-N3)-methyltransferase
MRLTRLFHDGPLDTGTVLSLSDVNAHHLKTVLRARTGQELVLFNGKGGEYLATICEISKKTLLVEINRHTAVNRESALQIVLAQGVSKGQRMDYCIQKAVELGACAIQPVTTVRCAVRQKGDRSNRKESHWQGVVTSAAEQSGRTLLPRLGTTVSLHDYLRRTADVSLKLVLDPLADTALCDLTPPDQSVHILTGPEGGLSEEEICQSKENGFIGIRMGPRILRTETAGVAAIAVMQALWGDLCRMDDSL